MARARVRIRACCRPACAPASLLPSCAPAHRHARNRARTSSSALSHTPIAATHSARAEFVSAHACKKSMHMHWRRIRLPKFGAREHVGVRVYQLACVKA
eukprot:8521-Pleurochrysis_carterae.AAC.1